MSAIWTWDLASASGARIAELTTATGKTITYRRNHFAEASCTIAHSDEAASLLFDALAQGIPMLRCYRRAVGSSSGDLRFVGHLAPFTEALEETGTLSLVFRSPFARLLGAGADRGRFTPAITYTDQDAGVIASNLITATNTDGATGLTVGNIEATKVRTHEFPYGTNVGQAIQNLTNVLDGFDFEEEWTETGSTFHVYAQLGTERAAAKFEYGPETLNNVRSVSRTTQSPVNVAKAAGGSGLTSEKSDPSSILTYGRWEAFKSFPNISEQATLDDKAHAALRPSPVVVVSFVPEYGLENCPKPFDDFHVGDTVYFYGRRDSFVEDAAARVNALKIVIDEDGAEAAEIDDPATPEEDSSLESSLSVEVAGSDTFGYYEEPTLPIVIADLDERVSALEAS